MFASLSAELRAPQLMRELGVSNAFIAALCGIEQTKLSFSFRQIKALSNEESKKLVNTLLRLIELSDAISPLQIDLKNPTNARRVLDAFEGKDLNEVRGNISALFE
jgi:hypothetical protein